MKKFLIFLFVLSLSPLAQATETHDFNFDSCPSIYWKSKAFSCATLEIIIPENLSPDLSQKNIKTTVSDGYALFITDALLHADSVFRTVRIVDVYNGLVFNFSSVFETDEYKNKTANLYPRRGGDWGLSVFRLNSDIKNQADYESCLAALGRDSCSQRWAEVEPFLDYMTFPLSPDDYQLCHMFPEQSVNHRGNPLIIYEELSRQVTEIYGNVKDVKMGSPLNSEEFDVDLGDLIKSFISDSKRASRCGQN